MADPEKPTTKRCAWLCSAYHKAMYEAVGD